MVLFARYPHRPISNCVLGCNPGLVSHFVRAALDDIVAEVIKAVPGARMDELRALHISGDYPRIAEALGLRVVHISEIDTQTTSKYEFQKLVNLDSNPVYRPRPQGAFFNTWSPMGFAEEALDWVQVGWGTHERPLPRMLVPTDGSRNQVFVPMHAMDLVMDSYVPHTPIKGMCIPHGEADTITEALTVYDDDDSSSDGSGEDSDDYINKRVTQQGELKKAKKAVYRPSVYYVYQCTDIALDSLDEMRKSGYVPQSQYHVLVPGDGLKGEDRVGVLLMFEDDPVRWVLGESDEKTKSPWSYWYEGVQRKKIHS
jgi:homospermidine synthase